MLTPHIEQTDSFTHPVKIMYHCSRCGKDRRSAAVVRRHGLCCVCYRIDKAQRYRTPLLLATPQKRAWKLDRVSLIVGMAFCLTALFSAIAGLPLPGWLSLLLLVPLALVALLAFYGMVAGSHAFVIVEVQQRPNCIDTDCEEQPTLFEKYSAGKSQWICPHGHTFYIGRLGLASRSPRWAW